METFKDERRVCVDCGDAYIWTERDQRFAHERGYLPPKRCPRCRQLQKQSRAQ